MVKPKAADGVSTECRHCNSEIEPDSLGGATGWRHTQSLLVRCSPKQLGTLASPKPSAEPAAPDIEAEGNGWPAGWCSSCDRMTSRGCVISGRPACDKCGDWLIFNGVQMPTLAKIAPHVFRPDTKYDCMDCAQPINAAIHVQPETEEAARTEAVSQAPVDGGRGTLDVERADNWLCEQGFDLSIKGVCNRYIAKLLHDYSLSCAASPAPIPVSPDPRVEEIRKRLEKITPGSWEIRSAVPYGDGQVIFSGRWEENKTIARWNFHYGNTRNDIQFIAAAPDDIRYLLDRNAALETELDRLKER